MSKAESQKSKTKRGRPRSEKAKQAILKAARELLDQAGPTRLTVEGVAQRAGVGKPTIYRYWSNAQELAMAVFMDRDQSDPAVDHAPESISDLYALIRETVRRLDSKRGRQMALMLASAEQDSELFKAFSNRVILDGRKQGAKILKSAIKQGEIAPDTDVDLSLDLIFGIIFLRLLLDHAPLGDDLADRAVSSVIKAAKP